MAKDLSSLVGSGSVRELQEKLENWHHDYEINSSGENMNRCCEILELNNEIQKQLYSILHETSKEDECTETIKSYPLSASLCSPPSRCENLTQDSTGCELRLRDLTCNPSRMQELEDKLTSTRIEINQMERDLKASRAGGCKNLKKLHYPCDYEHQIQLLRDEMSALDAQKSILQSRLARSCCSPLPCHVSKPCRPCSPPPCKPCSPPPCKPCSPPRCRPCSPPPCRPCSPPPCKPCSLPRCRPCSPPPCRPCSPPPCKPCSPPRCRPCSPPRCRPCSPPPCRPCSPPPCKPCSPPRCRPCSPPQCRPCSPRCRPCSPLPCRPCSPLSCRPCSPPLCKPCSPLPCCLRKPCAVAAWSPCQIRRACASRRACLIARFNFIYAKERLDAEALLRPYVCNMEVVQRIIYVAAVESFRVAKMAFWKVKVSVKETLALHPCEGVVSLEVAALDYIACHKDLYDVCSSIHEVICSMNMHPKLPCPAEVDFIVISSLIRELCRLAFSMQTLIPPLDVAVGVDGELFNKSMYYRSFDSDFSAAFVAYHVWPALMENDAVIVKGEVVTKTIALCPRRCRIRSRSCSCGRRLLPGQVTRSRSLSTSRVKRR